MPLLISLKIIRIRITFIPPPVDDEHPPTNIRAKISIFENVGHTSKSAVANPVVVSIERV